MSTCLVGMLWKTGIPVISIARCCHIHLTCTPERSEASKHADDHMSSGCSSALSADARSGRSRDPVMDREPSSETAEWDRMTGKSGVGG